MYARSERPNDNSAVAVTLPQVLFASMQIQGVTKKTDEKFVCSAGRVLRFVIHIAHEMKDKHVEISLSNQAFYMSTSDVF